MNFTLIDLYCERTAAGFWNEPINALSNIAFVVVAVLAWRSMSERSHSDIWEKCVIVLAGLIGIGSFLFHTLANGVAEYADIIPIWSFVASYTLLAIYRSTEQNTRKTLRIAGIALGISLVINSFTSQNVITQDTDQTPLFNGSLQYAPAFIALAVFSILSRYRKHPVSSYVMAATGIFGVALFFRSIDMTTCNFTRGLGTHFLWHLCNAVMIGMLLRGMILEMPPKQNTLSVPKQ